MSKVGLWWQKMFRELDAYPLVQIYGSKCESHSLFTDWLLFLNDGAQRSLSLDIGEQRVRALWRLPRPALPGLVGLDVFGEVVTPHEPLATLLAPKALLSGVCAKVPL